MSKYYVLRDPVTAPHPDSLFENPIEERPDRSQKSSLGWFDRQIQKAVENTETWPVWMRQAAGIHGDRDVEFIKAFNKTVHDLNRLRSVPENWNGYNVDAPRPESIDFALRWVQSIYSVLFEAKVSIRPPHVTANESGHPVLEWRTQKRDLVLYLDPKEVMVLKVWGPSMLDEMEDVILTSPEEFLPVWQWFLNKAELASS